MCTESPVHSTNASQASNSPFSVCALLSKLPVSAEERLEMLQQAVDGLITRERACMSASKSLRVHVERRMHQDQREIFCDMQGGFGRVVFQNDGSELGLPNDTYTLFVSGKEVSNVEVVSLQGKKKQLTPTSDKSLWRVDMCRDTNSHITVSLGEGDAEESLRFDCLSVCMQDEPENGVEESLQNRMQNKEHIVPVHWLAPIEDDVMRVTALAESVSKADDVCAHVNSTAPVTFLSAAELQEELNSLNRKLTRVVKTAESMRDRYLVEHNDAYYHLFAPGGGILQDASVMRVTTDDSFIQNDLIQLQENVDLLRKDIALLNTQELEYEEGDLHNIIQNIAYPLDTPVKPHTTHAHVASLEEMLQMRQELLCTLYDSIHAKPKYYDTNCLHEVVNRRVKFVTLSCVDAGIRAGVRLLSAMPLQNCMLDVNMCLYQMRQIMANDAHNDLKLDVREQEACLQKMLAVQSMSKAYVDAMGQDSVDVMHEAAESHVTEQGVQKLIGVIRVQKILNAIARHTNVPICSGFSHHYRDNASHALSTSMPMHSMSTEISKNGTSALVSQAQAQETLLQMLDADLRHRVISPLVHKHVSGAIRATREGKTCVFGDQIVQIFASDVQLLAKLALGLQEEASAAHVFAFLNDSAIRTGYNQDNKTHLLINLMFHKT